jgi:hypothetical protein
MEATALSAAQREALSHIGNVKQVNTVDSEDYLKAQFSRWNPSTGTYYVWGRKTSVKLYTERKPSEIMDGNYAYAGHLSDLLYSVDDTNCVCITNTHLRTCAPVTSKKELYKVCGYTDEKAARGFFKALKDRDIIIEYKAEVKGKKESRFYINPLLTLSKHGIHPETYWMFKGLIDPYLSQNDKINLQKICYILHHPEEIEAEAEEVESKAQERDEEALSSVITPVQDNVIPFPTDGSMLDRVLAAQDA